MNSYSKFFMSLLVAVLINVLSVPVGYASDEEQHQPDDQPISQSQVVNPEEFSVEPEIRMRIYLPIVCGGGSCGSLILCVDDDDIVVPCDGEPPRCIYGSCPPIDTP